MTSQDADRPAGRGMLRAALRGTGQALWGALIGLLALFTIPWALVVGVLWFLRVGEPLVPPTLAWVRQLADLERRRLGIDLAPLVPGQSVRRDLTWLGIHALWGLVLGALVVQLLAMGVHDLTFALWWQLVGPESQTMLNGWIEAREWERVRWAPAIGLATLALWLVCTPRIVEAQARPGHRLLVADPDIDLSVRVAELAATRAAALDAHSVELRRIERALHDGAQNRMVGAAVLVGAARREVTRAPDRADEILSRAQDTIEDALAELRAVVRSILPPVLENRGLHGALAALAADCPVPCQVTVDVQGRCPVSIEAAAYFMVAESLTNVAKHSGASHASVEVWASDGQLHVLVADDGRGGADPAQGSGLAGIIRRVAAHDGTVTLTSPVNGPTEIKAELPCAS